MAQSLEQGQAVGGGSPELGVDMRGVVPAGYLLSPGLASGHP